MQTTDAGGTPVDRPVVPLVARLRDEADLCRNEGATDIAALLDEAAEEMHNLAWALSLPGFDRMATDEQEAEHQAGVQRVNDMLARMEKAKAEHDAMVRDAARWRHVWQCVRIAQHGEYVLMPDDPTGLAEDSIARARFAREVDDALRHNA